MKKESTLTTFDLMDIWHIFIWHLIPIFAAAALAIAGLYVYAKFFKVTKYKSTATVYILKQEREGDSSYTQSDFTLALNVVNDCVYMIRSYEVLDDVIEELGLDMTASELSKCITTRNPDGTRILEVSVETPSPEQSKRIVDSVCRIGAEKISATMSMDQLPNRQGDLHPPQQPLYGGPDLPGPQAVPGAQRPDPRLAPAPDLRREKGKISLPSLGKYVEALPRLLLRQRARPAAVRGYELPGSRAVRRLSAPAVRRLYDPSPAGKAKRRPRRL